MKQNSYTSDQSQQTTTPLGRLIFSNFFPGGIALFVGAWWSAKGVMIYSQVDYLASKTGSLTEDDLQFLLFEALNGYFQACLGVFFLCAGFFFIIIWLVEKHRIERNPILPSGKS